ncbi:hypothetical protein NDN08_006289 [Rhodosorus marinus]|uniref:Translation elongation factor P/YeiP central domain-containing protein n=1 Tax=Rhodosorus marinus TaxID=101924 RepID=A0AAV8UNT5_9RHOD|nr:hypothetical protein NDN08_006289 [Rhodosorus marinus]
MSGLGSIFRQTKSVFRRCYSLNVHNLKRRSVIKHRGKLCNVEETPVLRARGRGGGLVTLSLRDLVNGSRFQATFNGTENVEVSEITWSHKLFLYSDSDNVVLMDPETYDQEEVPASRVPHVEFLAADMKIDVAHCDGELVEVQIPSYVEVEVGDAPEIDRQSTASLSGKRAILKNGAPLNVPAFVRNGDKVLVKLLGAKPEYVSRA